VAQQGNHKMTYKNNRCLFLTLFLFATGLAFAGGPWTQPKGGGYFQISISHISPYSSLFSRDVESINLNREVSDITLNGYSEYGLSNDLTFIGEFPFKIVSTDEQILNGDFEKILESGSLSGFSNIAIALKRSFTKQKLLISGQFRVEANTSTTEAETGLRTGVSAWGLTPSVSLGSSHSNFFALSDIGFRFRTNNYSHEFLLLGEVGATLIRKLLVIVAVDVRQSVTVGTSGESGIQTGLYPDNQEYIAYGLKLILNVTARTGINFARFGAFSGNLVAKSPSTTFGLFMRL
jgi:hypothetical protein